MRPETLETIIEELVNALSLAKWKLDMAEAEILKHEQEIDRLKKEIKNNG